MHGSGDKQGSPVGGLTNTLLAGSSLQTNTHVLKWEYNQTGKSKSLNPRVRKEMRAGWRGRALELNYPNISLHTADSSRASSGGSGQTQPLFTSLNSRHPLCLGWGRRPSSCENCRNLNHITMKRTWRQESNILMLYSILKVIHKKSVVINMYSTENVFSLGKRPSITYTVLN